MYTPGSHSWNKLYTDRSNRHVISGMVKCDVVDTENRSTLKFLQHEANRLANEGEFGQAISVHYDILRRYRGASAICEKAYLELGDIHILLMELDLAENYFKLALGYSPAKPHIHYLLGLTYSLDNRWDLAINEFRFCTDQDPERYEYWYILGWAHYQSGDGDRASECLHHIAALRTSEEAIADLGTNLFLHPDKAGSISYARLAVRVAPRNKYAKWMLKYLRDLHEFASAMCPPFSGS